MLIFFAEFRVCSGDLVSYGVLVLVVVKLPGVICQDRPRNPPLPHALHSTIQMLFNASSDADLAPL